MIMLSLCYRQDPAIGESCLVHNSPFCSTCRAPYRMGDTVGICEPICDCHHGVACDVPEDFVNVPGHKRAKRNRTKDESDNSTSTSVSSAFLALGTGGNETGQAVSAAPPAGQCTSPGECCKLCAHTHVLKDHKCYPICECPNGMTPPIGDPRCDLPKKAVCASCNVGFQLVSGRCKPLLCDCVNGVDARCDNCLVAGKFQSCLACNVGYTFTRIPLAPMGEAHGGVAENRNYTHATERVLAEVMKEKPPPDLTDRICKENKCICRNGVPALPGTCPKTGMHKCSSCKLGYVMRPGDYVCRPVCGCQNGIAAVGSHCDSSPDASQMPPGYSKCVQCDSGFRLDSRSVFTLGYVYRSAIAP